MGIWAYPITDGNGKPIDPPWMIVRANNESEAKQVVNSLLKQGEVVQQGHRVPAKPEVKCNKMFDEKKFHLFLPMKTTAPDIQFVLKWARRRDLNPRPPRL